MMKFKVDDKEFDTTSEVLKYKTDKIASCVLKGLIDGLESTKKEVNEMNEQNKVKIIELAKQISEILKETADPHTNVIIDINEVKVTQDMWKDNIGGKWN